MVALHEQRRKIARVVAFDTQILARRQRKNLFNRFIQFFDEI